MTLGPWISKFWYRYHYSSKQYTKYAFRMHSIFGGGPRSLYKSKTGKSIDIFGHIEEVCIIMHFLTLNLGLKHQYDLINISVGLCHTLILKNMITSMYCKFFSIQKHSHLKNYKEQGFFMRFLFISIFIYMRKLVWDKWIG